MKTTTFLITTALLWIVVLIRRGVLTTALPWGYRLSLIILSFLLLWDSTSRVFLLLWGIFHPGSFFAAFYARMGIFPPLATFFLTLVACAAGCVQYYIGFALAQQRRAGYLWGVRALPYLFVVEVLYFAVQIQKHLHGTSRDYYVYAGSAIAVLTSLAVCFWLYRFCTSARNQELLNRSTEPGAAPNGATAMRPGHSGVGSGPPSVN